MRLIKAGHSAFTNLPACIFSSITCQKHLRAGCNPNAKIQPCATRRAMAEQKSQRAEENYKFEELIPFQAQGQCASDARLHKQVTSATCVHGPAAPTGAHACVGWQVRRPQAQAPSSPRRRRWRRPPQRGHSPPGSAPPRELHNGVGGCTACDTDAPCSSKTARAIMSVSL